MDFASLKLSPELLAVVQELGFTQMTPIQAQAIPPLLADKDLVGQSKTGSGKTAAFAIPLLEKIDVESRTLQALVLCPTRELCTQVAREIRRLARRRQTLQVLIVSGGQPLGPQVSALRKGAHIVVGTPGRLVDLIHKNLFDASDLRTLILDEADRMLDMGFEEDMAVIMGEMPTNRQTVFFSATYPDSIQALSRRFQKNPVRVTVEDDETSRPDIRHVYFEAEPEDKLKILLRILRKDDPDAALIFCNLKVSTVEVGQALRKEHFSAEIINGDLEQRERDEVLAKFRNGSIRFLIATDVAARGLDIESLPMVIHYDLPHDAETYVHRAGRTGRAGQSGTSACLLPGAERSKWREIQIATGLPFSVGEFGSNSGPRAPDWQTVFIAGGRKEKVRPGDLLGALTGEAGGLDASEVGKIEVHDHFSYVAIARPVAEKAFRKLLGGRIKGQKFLARLLD